MPDRDSLPDQSASPAVAYIAKCAEHGLHGERDECFVCGKPAEHVGFVRADLFLQIRGRLDRRIHDLDQSWKARGRELNEIYDALTAAVDEPTPGMDPVRDLRALGAQRDRLRAENETLKEEQVAFVRDLEKTQTENERLRESLNRIARQGGGRWSGDRMTTIGNTGEEWVHWEALAQRALTSDEDGASA